MPMPEALLLEDGVAAAENALLPLQVRGLTYAVRGARLIDGVDLELPLPA